MNAEPNSLSDALTQMSGSDLAQLIGVSFVLGTLLVIVITVTVSKTVYRIHKNRLEDALKRELVDRGFSAEEIERIVGTHSAQGAAQRHSAIDNQCGGTGP